MLTNDMSPGPSSDEIQSGSRGVREAEVPARSVSRYRGAATRVTRPPAARYREAPAVVSASRARGLRGPLRSVDPPTYCALPRAAAVVSASRARGLRGPPRPGGRSTCRALSRGATAAPGSPERWGAWGPFEAPHLNGAPRLRRPDPGAFEDRLVPSAPATAARSRGAPRLRRGAPSVGGLGGPFRGPPFQTDARCE